jgi:hypothetical protein
MRLQRNISFFIFALVTIILKNNGANALEVHVKKADPIVSELHAYCRYVDSITNRYHINHYIVTAVEKKVGKYNIFDCSVLFYANEVKCFNSSYLLRYHNDFILVRKDSKPVLQNWKLQRFIRNKIFSSEDSILRTVKMPAGDSLRIIPPHFTNGKKIPADTIIGAFQIDYKKLQYVPVYPKSIRLVFQGAVLVKKYVVQEEMIVPQ